VRLARKEEHLAAEQRQLRHEMRAQRQRAQQQRDDAVIAQVCVSQSLVPSLSLSLSPVSVSVFVAVSVSACAFPLAWCVCLCVCLPVCLCMFVRVGDDVCTRDCQWGRGGGESECTRARITSHAAHFNQFQ
jgi:hypothetical protein